MKVIIKSLSEQAVKDNDYRQCFIIDVDGRKEVSVRDGGEPEDNSLGRDLSFAYHIPSLMKRAYDAGAKGEEYVVENIEIDDIEELY